MGVHPGWSDLEPRRSKADPQRPSGTAIVGSSVALLVDSTTALLGGPGDNGTVGAAWAFTGPPVSDDDLPLVDTPASITADASTPAGAIVTYALPTVVDEDDTGTASARCCASSRGATERPSSSARTASRKQSVVPSIYSSGTDPPWSPAQQFHAGDPPSKRLATADPSSRSGDSPPYRTAQRLRL